MDEDTRAQLQAIFRDELADRLDLIEARRAILASESSTDEELRSALEEIYRAAHTLKGAAQAVGQSEISTTCHALEDTLGAARGRDRLDRGAILAAVDRAVARIRPPSLPSAEETSSEGDSPARPLATAPAAGTVRVDLGSVKMLARGVQELSTMLGGADERLEEREIAGIAARLGDRIHDVRGALASSPELAGLHASLAEIFEALGTLRRSLALRRLQRGNLQAAAIRRVEELDEVMRQLRLTSARPLRLALEQAAREAARELGKDITFKCSGEDTSMDREVLDRMREPLTHVVRNAVDHGIESPARRLDLGKPPQGRIRLKIRADGPEAVFVLSDDGAGFDLEALSRAADRAEPEAVLPAASAPLEHAFTPGVSTRPEATATSGRGMGLSIVRDSVAALHGSVDVRSRPSRGAAIEIRVPIHLNAVDGLVVEIDGTELIIPTTALDRIVRARAGDVRVIEGGTWLAQADGELLPAVLLPAGSGVLLTPRDRSLCVVLGRGRRRIALWVDAVRDLRSIIVRPLQERALGSPCVRAGTIQTDGAVGLVLDVASVMRTARPAPAREEQRAAEVAPSRLLVVDDSITTRQLVRVVLESAGYRVTLAEDGEIAWRRLRDEGPFDLVVSDVDMPHLDGLGLLARIRATPTLRDVPVVLVTALEQEDDRQRALDMGADAYVGKSTFDQTSLLERIRDLLA